MRGGVGRFSPPSPRPRRAAACLRCLEERETDRRATEHHLPHHWSLHTHSVQHARHSSGHITRTALHRHRCALRLATFACVANRNSNTAPGTARGVAPRVEQHGCWENEDKHTQEGGQRSVIVPAAVGLSSLPLSLATRRALAARHRHQLAWGWTQLVPKLVPQLVPSNSGRNRRPSLSRPPLPKLRESPGTTHSRPS